jgi:hypothetical protein
MNATSTAFSIFANALEQLEVTLASIWTVAQLVLQKMKTQGLQIGDVEILKIIASVLTENG